MQRLIERGLMFGNLMRVDTPALVERYNRALKRLAGRQTQLTEFHIDLSGYSPEVGEELGDPLYLNPNGANRRFILLSVAQKTAPLLNAGFSTTRPMLRAWIDRHENQIFALTARDAVAGEMVNSVYDLSDSNHLFDMKRIRIEADTVGNHVAESRRLAERVDEFRNSKDGWWDAALIDEMIKFARQTGNVTKDHLTLDSDEVEQGNFWTSHFGGVYAFLTTDRRTVVTTGTANLARPEKIDCIQIENANAIARFLDDEELVEPVLAGRGADGATILGQKMDFILVEFAASRGMDLGAASARDLRHLAGRYASELPAEFHGLAALKRWAEQGGDWPKIKSNHPAYFYTLRAKPGPDADLVNQLLAELTPLDIRQLFICHKSLFYHLYRNWPDAKREYVANYLAREYARDKAGARAALFGVAASAAQKGPWGGKAAGKATRDKTRAKQDLLDIVGPWGSVKKGKRS